ncbi:hypothetical protein ACTFIU_011293 [Dictyostelium citrinum]
MSSFRALLLMSSTNANKTKKTFKVFDRDFPISKSMKNKVNELIEKKEFKKLKDMVIRGEKFLLSLENIQSLLLNYHDKEFYELIYEKKLLFDYNLIDEAIKLDNVAALELMVQIFANGWDNYIDNGPDFYKIMLKFTFNSSDFFKHDVSNYLITKTKRIDQLTVIALLIKQYIDILDIDNIPNNKSIIDACESHDLYEGFNNLKLKIIDQWRIYHSLISEFIKESLELKSQNHVDKNEKEICKNKILKFGKKIMILRILMLDLEAFIKLEKYKWNTIANLDVTLYLDVMLRKHFNISLEESIRETSLGCEIDQIKYVYPKFSRLTRFSNHIVNICLEQQYITYFNFKKLYSRDENGNQITLSVCSFLREYFYNSNISLSTSDVFQFGEPNINQFYLPTKEEIISTLNNESVNLPNHQNCFYANKFYKNLYKVDRERLYIKYCPTKYSPPKQINKREQIQRIFSKKLKTMQSNGSGSSMNIFPRVFSIPIQYEITIRSQHDKDVLRKEIEKNNLQEVHSQLFTKHNQLVKEFERDEKLKKEKEKIKKKLQKLKDKNHVEVNKEELGNKKKSEQLKKQNEQLILQNRIEYENKMKLKMKMKNKKKKEKRNKLLIEAANRNSKNQNNNNINNIKEDKNKLSGGSENEEESINKYYEANKVISTNLINSSNNNNDDIKINYDNIKNYHWNQQEYFNNNNNNNNFFDQEDSLDPNIQNEIDEKVTSLVYDEEDYEDDNNNINNNIGNNIFTQVFSLSVKTINSIFLN